MTIYEKATKELMAEWAESNLEPGQVFDKRRVVQWFKEHYPNIKSNTVEMHVEGMSINNRNRRHHANIKPGSGHDLFFKEAAGRFRLWDAETDPKPRYKPDIEAEEGQAQWGSDGEAEADSGESLGESTFAYERDLQNYLVRNLRLLEPGLTLYEEEGLQGVEYNAGGRFIDILARGRDGAFVIIELKVSRGYDRVVGQLLRYMAWVSQNLGDGRPVRGIIVANEITEDLRLATRPLSDVELFQYQLSFAVEKVEDR